MGWEAKAELSEPEAMEDREGNQETGEPAAPGQVAAAATPLAVRPAPIRHHTATKDSSAGFAPNASRTTTAPTDRVVLEPWIQRSAIDSQRYPE